MFLLLSLLFPPLLFSQPAIQPTKQIRHFIYITLDGTRWQDFYHHEEFFQKLWQRYAKTGQFYGGENNIKTMQVASIPISLPSYQSQMAGKVQSCDGNGCGRIKVETFPEKLVKQSHFKKQDVAVFASWWPIALAVEHEVGTIYSNTGNLPAYEPDSAVADSVMQAINAEQLANPYPTGNRYDQYTFAHAMHYFDRYQPKFLWISFVNADDAAHAGDLARYQQTLRFYDDAIENLMVYLEQHELMSETMIIITTDHGRGNGNSWRHHGPKFPESKLTWALVINGELFNDVATTDRNQFSTLSIRPTVEKALLG